MFMFKPHYSITDRLLANIKRVDALVNELNNRRFPHVVLVELEKTARAVSTYASTSIEGNPLPLTEVKKILKSKPAHIRDSEKEVLNYNRALMALNALVKQDDMRFDVKLILSIQKTVTDGLLPALRSGKLRQEPVFINNPQTRQPVYFPPDHQDVIGLLDDLLRYVNENKNRITSTQRLASPNRNGIFVLTN